MTANILRRCTYEERFVLCGDLNDVPDSEALTPLLGRHGRQAGLVNVLAQRESNEAGALDHHAQRDRRGAAV